MVLPEIRVEGWPQVAEPARLPPESQCAVVIAHLLVPPVCPRTQGAFADVAFARIKGTDRTVGHDTSCVKQQLALNSSQVVLGRALRDIDRTSPCVPRLST